MSKKSRRSSQSARGSSGAALLPPLEAVVGPAVFKIFEMFFDRLSELEKDGVDIQPVKAAMTFMVPHADLYQAVEQDAHLRRLVTYMRQAGVDESLIFAFEVTGRLVTEENRHLLDEDDVKEWFMYVDAYEVFGETARLAFGIEALA